MTRRTLLCLLTALLTALSSHAQILRPDDEVTAATARLSVMALHPVEGLWQMPGQPAVIEISRDPASVSDGVVGRYNMTLIRPASRSVKAGIVVGTLVPTGRYGVYDARIFTDLPGSRRKLKPQTCVLTLEDEESRLVMKDYGRSVRFRWWRLMPYMFRYTFTETEKRRGDIDGLVRLYPEPAMPINPVYL